MSTLVESAVGDAGPPVLKQAVLDLGLSWDDALCEPFLQLAAPLDEYILTPLRKEDAPRMLEVLNDGRVYPKLANVPHPYTPEHAAKWVPIQREQARASLAHLARSAIRDGLTTLPVHAIRHRSISSGCATWIGDVKFYVPDGSTTWQVGYLLDPAHWSKGVMTHAVRSLLSLLQRITVSRAENQEGRRLLEVKSSAYKGNEASVRVLQKAGFTLMSLPEQDDEARCKGAIPEYKLLYRL
ncbi:hypothetical protein FA10DRAFT_265550 [Acaromyces ingoldii]|uniref:N-acetyltransferase domain-containing protein n=1 Tax=Acaromyces ingoldii TaxID=215250 RepID=A0A316YSA6_9BASI|nr:hypothetical protein FA10DRAFT_265550 [Acaromyces ingoldii]PWN91704.1 hypothetical protein FA10DRAFT_265550 [Acaromyces ingoldii]